MFKRDKYYIDCYKNGPKWNWGAFIFGPLWLFYRRIYAYGFVYFIILFGSRLAWGLFPYIPQDGKKVFFIPIVKPKLTLL